MILYNTKFLQLKSAVSPGGKPWYYAHRPNVTGGVVIVPVIGDSIIFLETERPPIKTECRAERCIELPAGLMGDEKADETALEAINKELLEETGYIASKIEIVGENISSSPGCLSEAFYIAIAHINNIKPEVTPGDDGGIIKARHIVPVNKLHEQVKQWQKEGKSVSSQALAGLFFI
jgi:ADP-ribose pyrophosphatase